MQITVLGCGTSGGVPALDKGWGVCDPNEAKNHRRRSSILIEAEGSVILVDTGPDCRSQLLEAGVRHIDAVIYTHEHADHLHGIDELRWINLLMGAPIPIYGDTKTLAVICERFGYALGALPDDQRYYHRPALLPQTLDPGQHTIAGLPIEVFEQDHQVTTSLGLRLGEFAYSTDVKALDGAAFKALDGITTWIVDALQPEPHPTHAHVACSLGWIEDLGVEQAWFTHMNHNMDYRTQCQSLPAHVRPAYDGQRIRL